MKGKDKCELLRSIRQSIAELNGIQYSPKEWANRNMRLDFLIL